MKHLFKLLLTLALLTAPLGCAQAQVLFGVVNGGAAATYTGPGDITTFNAWYGVTAYSAATRGSRFANVCNSTGGVDVGCADMITNSSTGQPVSATVSGITCPGANCTIKILYDQTIGNNCSTASCDLTATTIARRLTFAASCSGSIPCLGASGAQELCSAGNYTTRAQPFSISYAAKRTTVTSFDNAMGFSNSVQIGFASTSGNIFLYAGSSIPIEAAAENAFHRVQNVINGASSNFYLDGAASGAVTTSTNSITGNPVCVGAYGVGGGNLTGQIFEAGVSNQDFTSSEAALDSSMHARLGI